MHSAAPAGKRADVTAIPNRDHSDAWRSRVSWGWQFKGTETGGLGTGEVTLLMGYAILMLGVCMPACVVPTLRALRVPPTEALRAE